MEMTIRLSKGHKKNPTKTRETNLTRRFFLSALAASVVAAGVPLPIGFYEAYEWAMDLNQAALEEMFFATMKIDRAVIFGKPELEIITFSKKGNHTIWIGNK